MSQPKFPNLFVVGAMKAGTTTLHGVLGSHPEIFMSPLKEPRYFAGIEPHLLYPYFDDAPLPDPEGRWYSAMFEPAVGDPQIRYAGEASPDYTKLPTFPGCAERIHEFNPEARIVYILRDPVRRSLSHYWHNVRIVMEDRGLLEAIEEDPEVIALSDYARQIEPYLRLFPRDQIYVMTLEAFGERHEEEHRKLFEWLGVDPSRHVPGPVRLNTKREVAYRPGPGMGWLARLMSTRAWVIRTRKGWGRKLHNASHKLAFRVRNHDTSEEPAAIARLRPFLAERALVLGEMLGRGFPEWTTTFPEGYPGAVVPAPADRGVAVDAGRS